MSVEVGADFASSIAVFPSLDRKPSETGAVRVAARPISVAVPLPTSSWSDDTEDANVGASRQLSRQEENKTWSMNLPAETRRLKGHHVRF